FEHERLVLGPAPQPDGAVGQVFEAELDISGERLGVEGVERRLRRVVVVGNLARRESLTTLPGSSGQVALGAEGCKSLRRKQYGLVAEESREGARTGLLGQKQRGSSAGMADPDRCLDTESIHRREHIGPETDPVKVTVARHTGLPVTTQVGCKTAEAVPKPAGQRAEHPAVEASRVYEESWRPLSAEIVQRQSDAVGRCSSRHWHGPSRLSGDLVTATPPKVASGLDNSAV